ncbi:hypothetical protein LJR009_006067 [Bosea sp. LjRoot9]|uniref:hypothetical protein n=1 Tax=Bosea sp. LjRoot9 TaxID=3342341 RepID=UPI003ECFB9FA
MTRLYVCLALGVLVALALSGAWHQAKQSGRDAERAEQADTIRRKLDDATMADDAHTRCLADPACRLSNDGYRRD